MSSKEKQSPRVLFFETYSILQVLCLFKRISTAKRILYLDTEVSWERALGGSRQIDRFLNKLKLQSFHELKKNFIHGLIRLINHEVEIQILNYEDFAQLFYSLNKDCLKVIDDMADKFKKSPAYRMMYKVVRDERIIRYYKSYMARIVPRWFLFNKLSKDLIHSEDNVVIIPDNLRKEYLSSQEYEAIIPYVSSSIFYLNRLRFLLRFVRVYVTLFLMPFALMAMYIKNGYGITKKGDYNLAMPVAWGVYKSKDTQVSGGVKRFNDDLYLYGDGLKPGQIVHIFGDWKFPAQLEASYKEAMNEKGIPYVEKKKYKLNKKAILNIIWIQWVILKGIYSFLSLDRTQLALLYAMRKGLYNYIKKYVEMENIDYKVEYVKTDYNPAHIINTILCNQNNRKTVAIAHAASPYDAPQIAFAHFDKYFALCEIYVKTFGPYWGNNNLVRTGRESLDCMWNRLDNKTETLNRINRLYGKRTYIVTITLPGGGPTVLDSRFEELYEGLCSLKDVNLDCHIFLRIRKMLWLDLKPQLKLFKNLPQIDSRMIFDHENFDTHQLISVSDLVIAANASWVINESLVADKKVFTFGFTKKEEMYFPDYGKDFILTRSNDITKVFKGLENQFAGFDCDWEKLKKDADYYHDGKNCGRIRQELIETIDSLSSIG